MGLFSRGRDSGRVTVTALNGDVEIKISTDRWIHESAMWQRVGEVRDEVTRILADNVVYDFNDRRLRGNFYLSDELVITEIQYPRQGWVIGLVPVRLIGHVGEADSKGHILIGVNDEDANPDFAFRPRFRPQPYGATFVGGLLAELCRRAGEGR